MAWCMPISSNPISPPYLSTSLRSKHWAIQARNNVNLIETRSLDSMSYWASINEEIEAHLKRAIRIREPVSVFEPMHHLTFDGPRSMAPFLCMAACELVSGHRAQALHVASALYVIDAAVQAHDYLPLTDRLRPKTRSRTVNHVFPSSIELQIGDGLFSFGYELLAGLDDPNRATDSGRILRVIVEVSRAMGSQGVVEGQYREIECDQLDIEKACEEGWLRHMYEKKDGGFHACGAACGAILGEASEEEIEKLRKYGLYVGTIRGMLHGNMSKDKEVIKMIQNLRELSLEELQDFNSEKVEAISSFLQVCNA